MSNLPQPVRGEAQAGVISQISDAVTFTGSPDGLKTLLAAAGEAGVSVLFADPARRQVVLLSSDRALFAEMANRLSQPVPGRKVLFMAATPVETLPLALQEEHRKIDVALRTFGGTLELVTAFAIRRDDLVDALLTHSPVVIHFSGHGTDYEELLLCGDNNNQHPVDPQWLKEIFRALQSQVKLVLLNACYSFPQAQAITECVDCAIGMRRPVSEPSALVFSDRFYKTLAARKSVQVAFDLAVYAMRDTGAGEDARPELLVKPGVDANTVFVC